jgi:4-nitrophenol 2-monooxygenase / 4-nitrocatechol 4-monooxygenase, reductase component
MPVDDAQFKLAMSHFASGVTIVTTEQDGKPFGMTVAAFSSLSLHPPLVLVCIEKSVRTHEAIAAAGKFGVSILSDAQTDVSNRFASRNEDKFSGIATHPGESGVPLIDGALTTLECTVREQFAGGDHSIFVGEVVAIATAEGAPLVYYRSGYRGLK